MNRDVQMSAARERGSGEGRLVVAVVGVDRYRHWQPLENAVNDAVGAERLFTGLGFEMIRPALLDEQATCEAMRLLVTRDLRKLKEADSLVLFFAGHGHTVVQSFEGSPEVKTGYILLVDADGEGDSVANWMRLDSWLSDVARLPARHILVILDACHSGIALGSVERWRGGAGGPSGSLRALSRRRSRRVITSALDDQRAMDGGPFAGNSLFTGCLIEALTGGLAREGRDVATGTEIGLYLQRRVAGYPGAQQTPDVGVLELDDRGELFVPLRASEVGAVASPTASPTPGRWSRLGMGLAATMSPIVALMLAIMLIPGRTPSRPEAPEGSAEPAPLLGRSKAASDVSGAVADAGETEVGRVESSGSSNPFVPIDGFTAQARQVTYEEYERYVDSLASDVQEDAFLPPETLDHSLANKPAGWTTFEQATRFCAAFGARLPTLAEWRTLRKSPKLEEKTFILREWTSTSEGLALIRVCGKTGDPACRQEVYKYRASSPSGAERVRDRDLDPVSARDIGIRCVR